MILCTFDNDKMQVEHVNNFSDFQTRLRRMDKIINYYYTLCTHFFKISFAPCSETLYFLG